jgi:hypothetical protein
VICSSTLVEDVPAADTFTVEDVCAVRSIGQDKITVDIMFEVKFVKSTMLKYLIESNTNTEMTKWLDEFFKVMKQVKLFSKKCILIYTPILSSPLYINLISFKNNII